MGVGYRQFSRRCEWWLIHRLLLLFGNLFFRFVGGRSKTRKIDLSQIKRVLIVRMDEIGDVVLTSPFLRELRQNVPQASITILTNPVRRNLVERCPHVNEVLVYNSPGPGVLRSITAFWRALRLCRARLWAQHFDLAVVPRWDHDSYYGSMLMYMTGARYRIGYSEDVTEEKRRLNPGLKRLLTHSIDERTLKHEVKRGLDLIHLLGGRVVDDRLELWIDQEDDAFADRLLNRCGVHGRSLLLAIGPGAGHPKRMWPISDFVELAAWFHAVFSGFVIVVGNNEDKRFVRRLRSRLGPVLVDAAGGTTLRQTGAVLKRCDLFVGNDAGPMHLAAAAGLPVVEISCHSRAGAPDHPNSPARFHPWRVPHIVLRPEKSLDRCSKSCNSDRAHCIRAVSATQVKEAVNILIKGSVLVRTTPKLVSHGASGHQYA